MEPCSRQSCWTTPPWRYSLLLAERSMKTDGVLMPCSKWWKRKSEQGNIQPWTLQRNHQIKSKWPPPLHSRVIWHLDWLVATVANSTHHTHLKFWSWWRTDIISSKKVKDTCALCLRKGHISPNCHINLRCTNCKGAITSAFVQGMPQVKPTYWRVVLPRVSQEPNHLLVTTLDSTLRPYPTLQLLQQPLLGSKVTGPSYCKQPRLLHSIPVSHKHLSWCELSGHWKPEIVYH